MWPVVTTQKYYNRLNLLGTDYVLSTYKIASHRTVLVGHNWHSCVAIGADLRCSSNFLVFVFSHL